MTNLDLPLLNETVFIAGQWQVAGGEQLQAINSSKGEAFSAFTAVSLEQAEAACTAAAKAFPAWRRLGGKARAVYLRAIAQALRERTADLAAQIMENIGKPEGGALLDIGDSIACFDYYADLAEQLEAAPAQRVDLGDADFAGELRYEPHGPAALILPWNFPLVTTAWKVAPALAVGCTVVMKPSEFATLLELVMGEIVQEIGLPEGVLNIVTGRGDIGSAICRHPAMRKISFTGSNSTGQAIMRLAAERSVPISLELGGKSAIIVTEDADLDEATRIIGANIFGNVGQVCSATSRLLVAKGIAGALKERLVDYARSLKIGAPSAPDVAMGPMATAPQRDKVLDYFAIANTEGLVPLTGGHALDREGYFIAPTIYWDVPLESRIWREEIFGPVLAVQSFESDEQAIALANDSDFGLAATIVGKDKARMMKIAQELEAGHIWLNAVQVIFPNTMWGGFKKSGIGRELGPHGITSFSAAKFITKFKG